MQKKLRNRGVSGGRSAESDSVADREAAQVTFPQLHAWLHQQKYPASTANNLGIVFTFHGDIDVDALHGALTDLSVMHEVLRTTYRQGANEPVALVHNVLNPITLHRDLRDSVDPLRELDSDIRRYTCMPFDLESGPVWRWMTYRISENEVALCMVLQHMYWDGSSFPVLAEDLAASYYRRLRSRKSDSDITSLIPSRQVVDLAAVERLNARLDKDRRYWLDHLIGLPALRWPVPSSPIDQGARADCHCTDITTQKLRETAERFGVTPFALVLVAWAESLGRYSPSDYEVTVGTLAVSRSTPGANRLVGNFSNLVALRLPTGADTQIADRLQLTMGELVSALDHSRYSFLLLAQEISAYTGTEGVPLFDSIVVFIAEDLRGPQLADCTTSWRRVDHGGVQFPLTAIGLEIFVRSAAVDVELTYRLDTISADCAASLLESFVKRLSQLVATGS